MGTHVLACLYICFYGLPSQPDHLRRLDGSGFFNQIHVSWFRGEHLETRLTRWACPWLWLGHRLPVEHHLHWQHWQHWQRRRSLRSLLDSLDSLRVRGERLQGVNSDPRVPTSMDPEFVGQAPDAPWFSSHPQFGCQSAGINLIKPKSWGISWDLCSHCSIPLGPRQLHLWTAPCSFFLARPPENGPFSPFTSEAIVKPAHLSSFFSWWDPCFSSTLTYTSRLLQGNSFRRKWKHVKTKAACRGGASCQGQGLPGFWRAKMSKMIKKQEPLSRSKDTHQHPSTLSISWDAGSIWIHLDPSGSIKTCTKTCGMQTHQEPHATKWYSQCSQLHAANSRSCGLWKASRELSPGTRS